ncbi:hypothetical protein H4Q26_014392 [Puccinia striiformis f. sp. tritici PST-130]|nr:hypothetical protein H4Q26_014392 [Puccinia striiformis f. sp. tritici PST-130]
MAQQLSVSSTTGSQSPPAPPKSGLGTRTSSTSSLTHLFAAATHVAHASSSTAPPPSSPPPRPSSNHPILPLPAAMMRPKKETSPVKMYSPEYQATTSLVLARWVAGPFRYPHSSVYLLTRTYDAPSTSSTSTHPLKKTKSVLTRVFISRWNFTTSYRYQI